MQERIEKSDKGGQRDQQANDPFGQDLYSRLLRWPDIPGGWRRMRRRYRRLKTAERWQIQVQLLLFAAAVGVGTIYWRQLNEMTAQTALNREELRLAYRARIEFGEVPPEPTLVERPGGWRGLQWEISYKNFGRGLATEIWIIPRVAMNDSVYVPFRPGSGDRFVTPETTHRPLGPGQRATFSDLIIDTGDTEWWQSHRYLIVGITLYYRDEFDQVHETAMCVAYEHRQPGYSSFTFCPGGNYSR